MLSPLTSQLRIIDGLKTAILLINSDKKIISINAAAEEFLQVSNKQLKNTSKHNRKYIYNILDYTYHQ